MADLLGLGKAAAELAVRKGFNSDNSRLSYLAIKKAEGPNALTEFADAIKDDPDFEPLLGGWMQTSSSGSAFSDVVLPGVMLAMAVRDELTEQAIEDVKRFGREKKSVVSFVYALSGATSNESVEIIPGVRIVVPSDIPEGTPKTFFSGEGRDYMDSRPIAHSYLVVSGDLERVLYKKHEEVGRLKASGLTRADEIASMFVACLVLLRGSPVAILGSWSFMENQIAEGFRAGLSWRTYPTSGEVSPPKPFEIDSAQLKETVKKWNALKSSERPALKICLDRISSASGRSSPVDRALDIGIALEVLLLHGTESKSEMTFRLSVRGAAFLHGKKSERLATFKLLKEMYALRSTAAHAGKIDASTENLKILESCSGACIKMANKVLERGGFPDWEADLILVDSAT